MNEDLRPAGGPTIGRLREALHADAELSPARLELERRRLAVGVVAASRRSRRLARGVLAGAGVGLAAAAAIAVVVVARVEPQETFEPASIRGLVRAEQPGALAPGRRAIVPADGGAKVAFADGTAVWLAADSAISAASPGGKGIRLLAGRALARVAPQGGKERFTVETPLGDIEVRGTVFAARLSGSGLTIDLYEGAVRFARGGRSVELRPGESLRVGTDGAIAAPVPIDRAAVLTDLLITEKTAQLPGAPVPRLAPNAGEAPRVAPIERPAAPPSAPAAEPIAPATTAAKRPAHKEPAAPAPAPAPMAEAAEPATEAAAPAPLDEPAASEIAVEPVPPAEEKLFQDAYDKAVAGEPEDARALLEQYLASYPDGRYWRRVAEILGEEP